METTIINDTCLDVNGAVLTEQLLTHIAYLQGDRNETINSGIEVLSDASAMLCIATESISEQYIDHVRTVVVELSHIREFLKLVRKPTAIKQG